MDCLFGHAVLYHKLYFYEFTLIPEKVPRKVNGSNPETCITNNIGFLIGFLVDIKVISNSYFPFVDRFSLGKLYMGAHDVCLES